MRNNKKKVLIALSSDSENLSLVQIYLRLVELGEDIDVWKAHQNSQAIAPFLRFLRQDTIFLDNLCKKDLQKYSVIICGRTCFEAFPLSWLLEYRGIIIADDTAMYDGKSVYGDVICVNGVSNARNISKKLMSPIAFTGCIKADWAAKKNKNKTSSRIYFNNSYNTHVLYVESGHFPFGSEGRTQLTEAFCKAVLKHNDKAFIVKPRFLRNEGASGRHRNSDHLYKYIETFFNRKFPPNLVLLETHEDMVDLLSWADIVLYTYSSAHIECVREGKPFFQLSGVPSIETADFRKNRMKLLEDFMDKAGCTIHYKNLSKSLYSPKQANVEYQRLLDGGRSNAIDDFCKIVRCFLTGCKPSLFYDDWIKISNKDSIKFLNDNIFVRKQRILGYIIYKVCTFENRFDNYSLLDEWLDNVSDLIHNNINSDELVHLIDLWIDEKVINLLEQRKSSDSFTRAFALRYYHESGRKQERDSLLDTYTDKDTAWLFYSAMRELEIGDTDKAILYLSEYIRLVDERGYALTDAERNQNVAKAKELVNAKKRSE